MARRERIARMPYRSVPLTGFAYAGTIEDEKFGGRIVYESGVERDALIHLVFEPCVAQIRRNDLSDEARLRYKMPRAERANWDLTLLDGRTVTPDFHCRLVDARDLLVEVGPHDDKTSPAEAARLREAAIVAVAEGAAYVVLTDRMIRGRLLENRRAMFGWLEPVSASKQLINEAARRFTGQRQRSIDEVVEELEREGTGESSLSLEAARAAVARAHRRGHLRCPLSEVSFDLGTPCAIVPEAA